MEEWDLLNIFFQVSDDFFFILNESGHIVYLSPTVIQGLKYLEGELLGSPIWTIYDPKERQMIEYMVWHQPQSPWGWCGLNLINKEREVIPVETKAVRREWQGKSLIFWFSRDVSRYKEAEEKFYKGFYANPVLMVISRRGDGRILQVNEKFIRTLGYAREELLGRTTVELNFFVHPGEREDLMLLLGQNGRVENKEISVRTKSGKIITALLSADTVVLGRVECLISTMIDITYLKELEQTYRKTRERHRFLTEYAPAIIYACQADRLVYVNREMCRELGYTKEELMDKKPGEIRVPENDRILGTDWDRGSGSDEVKTYETKMVTKDGRIKWFFLREAMGHYQGERAMIGSGYNVSRWKHYEEKVQYLSFHDSLTGLFNRAYFEEEMKRLDTRRQLPLAIIFGDINGLKFVNDALGHAEGDRMLVRAAQIIRGCCRKEDIVARIGEDEFAILLPNTLEEGALTLLDRVRKKCEQDNKAELNMDISISFGLSIKDDPDMDMKKVLKTAENRMYRNKFLESKSRRNSQIVSLLKVLDETTHETTEHCWRMQDLGVKLGKSLGLSLDQLEELRLISVLHDIGKAAIPENILSKPEPLTDDEWIVMKKHAEIGSRIVTTVPELVHIAEIILCHQEKWDGSGYPRGLKGEEIPLCARIIAVLDAYDAMTNDRPYRKALEPEEAIHELWENSGTQFDPEIISVFVNQVLVEELS